MEITEVRIKLMEESEDRLRAFCSITLDHCFVIRDLKIIEGTNGPFVAMPSRKMSARCGRCGSKNHLRSHYCNQCGTRLRGPQDLRDVEGGANKLYADIAHPINQPCRDMIQQAVIREYSLELERAKQPGYVSRYDEEYLDTSNAPTHATTSSASEPTGSIATLPPAEATPEGSPIGRPHFLDAKPEGNAPSNPSGRGPRRFGDGVF
ncbi:MAG: stage V sporulation protein G [Planctomycetes bacterium]|nr:stage V sporulation protein G [Planctomycetota bacterium]